MTSASSRSRTVLAFAVLLLSPGEFGPSARESGPAPAWSAAQSGTGTSAGVLLAEVLFDPVPGDSPFVELLNAGQTPTDLTGMALSVGNMQLPLVRVAAPLAPGARLLVRFDGQGRVDAGVLHLPSVSLDPDSGAVALFDDRGDLIDRVAWGSERGAVIESRGVLTARGRTLGRPPGANLPFDGTHWMAYVPDAATPGALNPLPAVEMLLPADEEVVNGPSIALDWYPVTGAASYRVQVARDESFGALLVDRTSDVPRTPVTLPGSGRYVWRVQAISPDGHLAVFSPVAAFVTRAVAGAGTSAALVPIALAIGRSPDSQTPVSSNSVVLQVPLLEQHKDTRLLQLENRKERDPHGWDRNHGAYDPSDPADTNNCVVASAAMINRWLGGDLSQDRIAYEVRSREGQKYANLIAKAPDMAGFAFVTDAVGIARHFRELGPPGAPEWDLIHGRQDGLTPVQTVAALTFATRPAKPSPRDGGVARTVPIIGLELTWNLVTREIDASRPVVASKKNPSGTSGHAFVVHGYVDDQTGRRFLLAQDPIRGSRRLPLDTMPANIDWYFLPENPRGIRQELSVTQDSDFDGVVDFDETERFFTDPNNRDSDGDGVWDKEDIASGVFDSTYGYAFQTASRKGRDFDADNLPTERDPDSDAGGCRDGVEDADGNGSRDKPETWNFDDGDDLCGNVNGHIRWSVRTRGTGLIRSVGHETGRLTVALTPEQPGELGPLKDNGSSYRVGSVGTLTLAFNGGCQPYARHVVNGSGTFGAPGTEIGGTVSDDELVIGAIVSEIPGTATADLCFTAGSNSMVGAASLPDCSGQRVGTSRSFRFSCTTPPPAPPDVEILEWSITGSVTIAVPRQSPPPP